MGNVEYAVVASDSEVAHDLSDLFSRLGVDGEMAELQGLGGSINDWLLAGAIAAPMVSHLLKAIYPYVDRSRVKSIKVGDIEIMHPKPEDVTRALDLYGAKVSDQPDSGAHG